MKEILEKVKNIAVPEKEVTEKAWARLNILTKPLGSLGYLEEIAAKYVSITGNISPVIEKKKVFVFAGDHGVTEEGVSLFPKEVTAQMVLNFIRGGAGVNVLARHVGTDIEVIDVGVDFDFEKIPGFTDRKVRRGTGNIAREPAMTEAELADAVGVGFDIAVENAAQGYHLFATGEMGIGNTTPSSAIVSTLTGKSPESVTGRGTGLGDDALKSKIEIIKKCLAAHELNPGDPLDVLRKVGGLEIAAITGLVLGAAVSGVPVVVDGFISTAAALVAVKLEPKVKEYIFQGHRSVEPGHNAALEAIGVRPVLDLDMRLGEGTGAVMAMSVIEAAVKIYNEMATFADAGVSGSD